VKALDPELRQRQILRIRQRRHRGEERQRETVLLQAHRQQRRRARA